MNRLWKTNAANQTDYRFKEYLRRYNVKLLPKAFKDLDEIYSYIKDDFKELNTANKLVDLLEEAIMSLDEMPYRGARRQTGIYAYKGYRQNK